MFRALFAFKYAFKYPDFCGRISAICRPKTRIRFPELLSKVNDLFSIQFIFRLVRYFIIKSLCMFKHLTKETKIPLNISKLSNGGYQSFCQYENDYDQLIALKTASDKFEEKFYF